MVWCLSSKDKLTFAVVVELPRRQLERTTNSKEFLFYFLYLKKRVVMD
jgi:hypothetical protein